jgi:hypothetical protein
MKARTSVLTLALCFLAGAVCFASDAQMGTWKLNEARVEARCWDAEEQHNRL